VTHEKISVHCYRKEILSNWGVFADVWSFSDRETYRRLRSSSSLLLYWRQILCDSWKDIWKCCLHLLKGKIRLKYNLYLFVYVISYCRINLWHVWSFSDRETYFVVWTPLILCFFIEGNSVCDCSDAWNLRKNFWNHYDQIGKHRLFLFLKENLWKYFCSNFQMWKKQIEKTYRRLQIVVIVFLYWRKLLGLFWCTSFALSPDRENISSPMALFFVSFWSNREKHIVAYAHCYCISLLKESYDYSYVFIFCFTSAPPLFFISLLKESSEQCEQLWTLLKMESSFSSKIFFDF